MTGDACAHPNLCAGTESRAANQNSQVQAEIKQGRRGTPHGGGGRSDQVKHNPVSNYKNVKAEHCGGKHLHWICQQLGKPGGEKTGYEQASKL